MGVYNGVELAELVLTSERLTLRPWRPEDAGAVYQAMQDARMHTFLMLPNPYTREDARRFVTTHGDEGRGDGTGLGCAVLESATGRLVGSAAIWLPTGRVGTGAEVGYWIAPGAQGNGFAADATRVLTRWAFGVGVSRVEVRCAVGNLASARAALGAGLRYEAVLRGAGRTPAGPVDHAVFGRLAGDSEDPFAPVLAPLPAAGLSDGVVRLRTTRPADAAALLDEANNAESVRWQFSDALMSEQAAVELTARAGLDWLVGRIGRVTILDLASGEVAGTMSLRQAGPPRVLGIGYGVRPAFRGHGVTARALRLLAGWAFDEAGIGRLELGAKAANIASQKAALAAGFEPDGIRAGRLRNPDGTFSDEVRFALTRCAP